MNPHASRGESDGVATCPVDRRAAGAAAAAMCRRMKGTKRRQRSATPTAGPYDSSSKTDLAEWGTGIRRALTQVAAKPFRGCLPSCLRRGTGSEERIEGRRQRNRVPFAAQWTLRQEQGRADLGSAMADILYGAQRRRLIHTIAGGFPCQALLHRWGRPASHQCLLCRGEAETISHIQNWCPALKEARIMIAAHHALAAKTFRSFQDTARAGGSST